MTIPIGNADAGSYFNDKVLAAVDYGMANVHPWFANVSVEESAGWTWEFFQENDVQLAQSLGNAPQMYIAETGWPTVRFFPFPPSPLFWFRIERGNGLCADAVPCVCVCVCVYVGVELIRCGQREQRPLNGLGR